MLGYASQERVDISHVAVIFRVLDLFTIPRSVSVMVEQAWCIVQPVLDAWAAEKADFPDYDSGSDGPNAADELLARDGGRVWRPVAPLSEQKT